MPIEPSWSRLRPVLVVVLMVADGAVVAALAIERPRGWVAPLIAFTIILLGLVGLTTWAIKHRGDDQ